MCFRWVKKSLLRDCQWAVFVALLTASSCGRNCDKLQSEAYSLNKEWRAAAYFTDPCISMLDRTFTEVRLSAGYREGSREEVVFRISGWTKVALSWPERDRLLVEYGVGFTSRGYEVSLIKVQQGYFPGGAIRVSYRRRKHLNNYYGLTNPVE